MSEFERDSLTEVIDRIRADFNSRIEDGDALLRRSMLDVHAVVFGGALHGEYGAIQALSNRILPIHGDEQTVLDWANMLTLPRLQPQYATGLVELTGSDGEVLPADRLLRAPSGEVYQLDADVVISGTTGSGTVTAAETGVVGNLVAGTTLNLVTPANGIDSTAVVGGAGITGGADIETIPALLERVLLRVAQTPRGGAFHDYERWARDAHPLVTRVFPVAHEYGKGTVVVRFLVDDPDRIPDSAVVDAVRDYIAAESPLDMRNLFVEAPNPVPRAIHFDAIEPNTQAVRDAIEAELEDLFSRYPVPGQLVPTSKIDEAASLAEGEQSHSLTTTPPSLAAGDVEVLGAVTWPS